MKPSPRLHPVDLLMAMRHSYAPTPQVDVKLEAQLIAKDDAVEMYLAKDDQGFQLHLQSPAAIEDLRQGLHKMLNVWDITAPLWLWQLDALLDPISRRLSDEDNAAKGFLPR